MSSASSLLILNFLLVEFKPNLGFTLVFLKEYTDTKIDKNNKYNLILSEYFIFINIK